MATTPRTAKKATAKKAKTSGTSAAAIERELNSDSAAQQAFLKDPTGYLSGKDMKLVAKHSNDIESIVADLEKARVRDLKSKKPKPGLAIFIGI